MGKREGDRPSGQSLTKQKKAILKSLKCVLSTLAKGTGQGEGKRGRESGVGCAKVREGRISVMCVCVWAEGRR